MKFLTIPVLLSLIFTCSCASPQRQVKKYEYYEPTKQNAAFCKQPSVQDVGHGPIKSVQYESKTTTNFNITLKGANIFGF